MENDKKFRYFGQPATSVVYENDKHRRAINYFKKNFLHYRPEIFLLASQVIEKLGLGEYTSMHIRRGDLQYKQSKKPAETTLQNTKELLKPGETLYISSDEKSTFFDPLR